MKLYEHEEVRKMVDVKSKEFLENEFVNPDYYSFAHFLSQSVEEDSSSWLIKPACPTNLLDLVESEDFEPQGKHHWIIAPNANSDDNLQRCLNDGHVHRSNVSTLGGVVVERGQMKFLQNDTSLEVRLEGRYRYFSPNTSWVGGTYDPATSYIKRGPITITTIPPGHVGIALLDNNPKLLLPGRHAYNNPLFLFDRNHVYDINVPVIHLHTITIINIQENQVAVANVDNQYQLLLPGLHMYNNPSFSHDVTVEILGPHCAELTRVISGLENKAVGSCFKHGTITLARVRPNEYGCAFVDNTPKLLYPGFYVVNSPSFSFRRTVLSNMEHISFGPLHVVNIARGMIALITDNNKPLLIDGPGVVMINSTLFKFQGMKSSIADKLIVHGSITRYRIPTGNIGFARRRGVVEKLSPGIRVVDDPDFVFIRDVAANQEIIQEGHYSLITTHEGGVRPVWVNGVLEILHEGFKEYTAPNLVVGGMIALSPPIIEFNEIEAYTRDRSQMLISGQVEYEVANPKHLVTTIGADKLVESLEKRVDAILRHALAITDLSSISPEPDRQEDEEMAELRKGLKLPRQASKREGISVYQPSTGDKKKQGKDDESSSDFTDQLSTQATKELSLDTARWGIKVIKVEVSDIHYKDQKVENAISQRTTQTRIAEADYDLTLVKNRQELVETEATAQQEYIIAENATKKSLLAQRTKATNEDIENEIMLAKQKAEVEAEAIEIKGKAEAEAAKVLEAAKAEARAIEIRAEAALLATKKKAEGERKLLEVEHKRYGGPEALLELELMMLEVEMAEAAAGAKVPTVSMNTSQASEGSLLAMLRNQGTGLFRLANEASRQNMEIAKANREIEGKAVPSAPAIKKAAKAK